MSLPAYTSIGCYPIIYFTAPGNVLCASCASEESTPPTGDVYWEGEPLSCDECGGMLESAYGEAGL